MPATYEPIATQTLGSDTASVTFSNIPGTYTDLVISTMIACTNTGQNFRMRFNSDTGVNYSVTALSGNGSAASSGRTDSTTGLNVDYLGTTGSGSIDTPSSVVVSVMSYANTNVNKTMLSAASGNGSGNGVDRIVGLWRSTAAITSVTLYPTGLGNTLESGSTFSLYGIKAA